MRDKILTYMAQGVKATQIASIVGCTPSYVAQLGKDEGFLKDLAEARAVAQQNDVDEDTVLTNKYMVMEHKILDSMEAAMALAELPALTRALEVIATRQEKRALRLATPAGGNTTNVIVNLTMPSHAVPEYQVNAQKEVVAIGNKAISPMSSAGVQNLFKQLAAQRAAEAVQQQIPETAYHPVVSTEGSEF